MSFEKKIFNEKLYFRENAISKIRSLENIDHQPRSNDKQIYTEQLPWLRYNRPNLPESVKEKINRKQFSLENKMIYSTVSSSDNDEIGRHRSRKLYLPRLYDDKKVENDTAKIEIEQKATSPDLKQNRRVRVVESTESEKRVYEEPEYLKKEPDSKRESLKPTKSIKTLNFHPQRCDASTETVKETLVSVEVQTNEEISKLKSTKLQKALRNSNTFEYNFPLNSKKNDLKSYKTPNDQKEDIITSRVIETFLPSIKYADKENKATLSHTYAHINSRRGGQSKTNDPNPATHAVTYAGMDFLDQYWATQRQLKLNKEFNLQKKSGLEPYDPTEFQWSDAEALFLLHSNSPKLIDRKVEHSFRDLYKERVQYYSEPREESLVMLSPNIDRITAKDLQKIII